MTMTGAEAWTALQLALSSEAPACQGDVRFVSDGRSRRTTAELAELCDECPILSACEGYARAMGPHRLTAGFWAGRWRGKPHPDDEPRTPGTWSGKQPGERGEEHTIMSVIMCE